MDLAGPKIRTGEVRQPSHDEDIYRGELLAITRSGDVDTVETALPCFAIECSLPDALKSAKIGDRVYIDGGKLAARIERVEPWGMLARVVSVAEKGLKLKPEKGAELPR